MKKCFALLLALTLTLGLTACGNENRKLLGTWHGSILPGVLRQRIKNFFRLIQGKTLCGAVGGQTRQQPLCAEHKPRAADSILRLRGQRLPAAAAHTNQCDHCNFS